MNLNKAQKPCFTVRKVTDNHWGLVYKECPARSVAGQVHRFQTEKDAKDMAQRLNELERQESEFSSARSVWESR